MADWTVTREDNTTFTLTRPDNECPYPWGGGIAMLDPADGTPTAIYAAADVRHLRINPLPGQGPAGSYRYRLTLTSGTTIDVFTPDPFGLATYGEGFITVSRGAERGVRYILAAVRWSFLRSIVRDQL